MRFVAPLATEDFLNESSDVARAAVETLTQDSSHGAIHVASQLNFGGDEVPAMGASGRRAEASMTQMKVAVLAVGLIAVCLSVLRPVRAADKDLFDAIRNDDLA